MEQNYTKLADLLVRHSVSLQKGEKVLIDNTEVTLKRLRKKHHAIALEPANSDYKTRIFGPDQVQVQGKLVGVIRKY